QTRALLRQQFSGLEQLKIDRIPEVLRHPLKYGFRTILYVAEDQHGRLLGAALLDHDAELSFCYLDYLASDLQLSGRGVGGALYDRIRSEALSLQVVGLFYECLPDSPELCRDPAVLKQNRSRLRFYERYGARPVINTAYETPVKPGGDNPPYLVFDDLGQKRVLSAAYLKNVVRAILQRKYDDLCPAPYVDMVVDSIRDNPVRLRPARRDNHEDAGQGLRLQATAGTRIALVVSDQEPPYHAHDRGWTEAPAPRKSILKALPPDVFTAIPPAHFSDRYLLAVHEQAYVAFFKKCAAGIDPATPAYPHVFPVRQRVPPPEEQALGAGFYCLDACTPISRQAWLAARNGADCALTAAREILAGRQAAYALTALPGHHAQRGFFGGFCYFNHAAIAAEYLSSFGKVAILDVDYHHGSGQQEIFYRRRDVLTASLHAHPRGAFPYFSGRSEEKGADDGLGFNLNLTLPEHIDAALYMQTLERALRKIESFQPSFLVVCLGFDIAKGDPTGTWPLLAADFAALGAAIAHLRRPCLIVQEGGYRQRSLGSNARAFFTGLADSQRGAIASVRPAPKPSAGATSSLGGG
ncbi:MAG: histone deacetylase family protein, partial [Lentisphaeria bacterium]|nr:histone deacetylase family protein [Lentisphaeria bacterium]